MNRATSRMRNFAGHLITHEAKASRSSGTRLPPAFRVCEKLRAPLVTLLGSAGFHALFARALALASQEVPWLRSGQVLNDGSLVGLDELPAQTPPRRFTADSAVLVAQLLGLLAAFIGEKLTLQLVRETWPRLPRTPLDPSKGKTK
jgi:hypothetical protein